MIGMCADIECLLSFEMKATGRGSILHDQQSKYDDHYFGLFSYYMTTRIELNQDGDGGLKKVGKAAISLLFVSLLHVLDKDDDDDEEDDYEESPNFFAETHTS